MSSGTGGAVSITGGASTTSTTGVGGALTLSVVSVARRPWRRGAVTVSSGAAHTSGAVTISSGAGATTNGGIVVDAKTSRAPPGRSRCARELERRPACGEKRGADCERRATKMSVTAGGTGSITLTPGDDFTVDAGDDVSIDALGVCF